MDDVDKQRRTNRRSRVETERDAGLEVVAEWAKEPPAVARPGVKSLVVA